ncbi:MAG: nicotinate (nicotinamide) nucleotide adenylyltransferase [Akkermansiaceae bacterium]
MKSAPRKIALFGGTFDPIHLGHLEIAARARDEMKLDEVVFLPCRRSPHKDTGPIASDRNRLVMLKAATSDLPWATVSDFEFHRPAPSYTWETVEAFQNSLPVPTSLFLLIGLDQWEALPRWSHPHKIAAIVEFLVFGRDGNPQVRENYRAHFFKCDHPASSTIIRADLAAGRPAKWLPAAVENLILEKGFYLPIR